MNTASALYIHMPWCEKKCPYCDFNSHAVSGRIDSAAYIDDLCRDFRNEIAGGATPVLDTVFIGGGTPSLFPRQDISRLLHSVFEVVQGAPTLEVTLEANPSSADAREFEGYREAGVNRLSLGIQSFSDVSLGLIGRTHTADVARRSVTRLKDVGFKNFNIDLMFGLPGQDGRGAIADLKEAIELCPSHISWYQLTIESGTAFAKNPPSLPPSDEIDAWHQEGIELLRQAGFDRYEVSAFARKGYRCKHNLKYWRFEDYFGIGAGAHSKVSRSGKTYRRERFKNPMKYRKEIAEGNQGFTEYLVNQDDVVTEFVLNVLRLKDGFKVEEFKTQTGLDIDYKLFSGGIRTAVQNGWLKVDRGHVTPTDLGFRFLEDVQLLFVRG
jgi:putative oxygen-independent coproporphyrinogen III oxidase